MADLEIQNPEAKEVLTLLQSEYPGQLLFSIPEVAKILRLKTGTLYNRISKGTCPVHFSRRGRRPMALVTDLARGIAEQR